ncbi:hypothetical protein ColTof4_06339 [Colletotrichum tofieldiae]|uniref:Uncharacterized protein n=1 Tax=Colletotrichum liriopes TaxID=708192 RepID=A0AA37GIB4_9PEZI|nr:hypothetical protein ColLi_03840 [Colletotrichum liriopes]GKT54184.1 hypothetical protein ColTof3_01523 [Colletotrichum tofieldiae]GKT73916.1 hypothetical protein ColTof4_06339 [Colletotrichum tofieldiae]
MPMGLQRRPVDVHPEIVSGERSKETERFKTYGSCFSFSCPCSRTVLHVGYRERWKAYVPRLGDKGDSHDGRRQGKEGLVKDPSAMHSI